MIKYKAKCIGSSIKLSIGSSITLMQMSGITLSMKYVNVKIYFMYCNIY